VTLKEINAKLLDADTEELINPLLKNKLDRLDNLLGQLKQEKGAQLPSIIEHKDTELLTSRIKLNTKKGLLTAAQRDQIELAEYKVNLAIQSYLNYLIKSSINYRGIDKIIEHSQRLIDKNLTLSKSIATPASSGEGRIFLKLQHNYQQFLQTNQSYQDILKYVINNPRKIASIHWFQEFSLLSGISYVNHFDIISAINYKLVPFKVDIGGIVLSLGIYFLVYFSHPFVFKFTSWCIESYIIDQGVEQQEMIYHEIRRPARALLVFFGLNLGTYALFYKTDYRSSLEDFSFILYSIIFIWLIFKIIDSIVLVQVQKLSNSNIQLRKELFNLGVQTGKGIVVIFFLALGLNHFGISLTAIMSTLGVGGLAFALAAKDTLSNLFGGITILFDNVFKMGDWVRVGNEEGTVAEIGLRSTTIRTFDNALITIPNSLVSISSVMNWDRRAVGRRIKMTIGITYDCQMDDLKQGVEDIREMLRVHPDISNPNHKHASKARGFKFASKEDTQGIKTTQLVFVDKYSDCSIDVLIYCFTRTVNWEEWLTVKEDVLYKIADILKQNNLEFSYPTQTIIHRLGDDYKNQ
jgi:MscS family membrane protein